MNHTNHSLAFHRDPNLIGLALEFKVESPTHKIVLQIDTGWLTTGILQSSFHPIADALVITPVNPDVAPMSTSIGAESLLNTLLLHGSDAVWLKLGELLSSLASNGPSDPPETSKVLIH